MVYIITDPPRRSRLAWICGIAGIVIGMYLLIIWLPFHIFGPRLEVVDVVVPEKIKPGYPFQVGLKVDNVRWGSGAAYVVFTIEGETEIEGPVTAVPAREERDVMVTLDLETGVRNGSLILYDAMHDNQRLAVRSGVHLVIGSLPIRLIDADYPHEISRGETMTVSLMMIADKKGPFDIVPIAITSDSNGRHSEETDGRELLIDSGAHTITIDVPTIRLDSGTHRLAVGLYDPAEQQWIGQKISRREFAVIGP